MRWPGLPLFVLLLAGGCTTADPLFVAWPILPEGSLSFFVSLGDAGRQVVGPIGPSGPAAGVSFRPSGTTLLITFEERWLLNRHVRVDAEQLDQIALVDRPSTCTQCTGPCRGESDELIFHPIDVGVNVLELGDARFEPTDTARLPPDLWVALPARWQCEETIATRELRYVDRWSRPDLHWEVWDMGQDRYLLGGRALRKLGEETTILAPREPVELFLGAIPWGEDRALVIARRYPPDESVGRLLEVDLSGPLTVVREQELPINPNGISWDEGMLIVPGYRGQIATSTDAAAFQVRQVLTSATILDVRRFVDLSPSYLASGTRGTAFQGDFASDALWTVMTVSQIDRALGPFTEVRGPVSEAAPDGRWLWTRSGGRGVFERPLRGGSWGQITLEPPRSDPRCIQETDEVCGFSLFPQNSTMSVIDGSHALAVTPSCSKLLVARPELGCASSIEPSSGFSYELTENGGSVIAGREFYLVVSDGVVAFPLD